MSSVLKEVDQLLKMRKTREINIIGQDTSAYGMDLYGKSQIDKLLKKLSLRSKGRWLRLLYTHPAYFSEELISVIKNESSICKYIDLPLQHINDKILTKMRRGTSREQILSLINKLREKIPDLVLRTTLIVGFPGETEAQFKELLNFMQDVRFERLGLFKYSQEEGSPAYKFSGQLQDKVKQARYNQALSLQQDISTSVNQKFLGKTLRVLIDEQDPQDKSVFLARSEYDAPEVDGCVYVKSKKKLNIGDFVKVKITDTLEYDLVAEVA